MLSILQSALSEKFWILPQGKEDSTELWRTALGKTFGFYELRSSFFSDCFLSQVIRIPTAGPNLMQAERDWLTCGCSWRGQPAQMLSKPQTPHGNMACSFPLCLPSPPARSSHLRGLHHPTTSCSAMDKSSASGVQLLLEQFWHPT